MRSRWVILLAVAVACGDGNKAKIDAAGDGAPPIDAEDIDAPIDANPNMPATLADTGLCLDPGCTQISPDVHAYTPQFPLWSDTATKRRWMYLPPGTQIDTSDMDHWVFPVGTKFWKEFTRDGIRVETRFILRTDNPDPTKEWFYVAYAWNQTQDATVAVTSGMPDANGTMHDIPPRSACRTCHDNLAPTRILGFGAIQLDKPAAAGEIDLDDVVASGWLTNAPAGNAIPHYPLPGGGTPAQAALGYMHANCGHCHNPTSKIHTDNGVNMLLRLDVGTLGSVDTTPAYMTTIGVNATMPVDGLTTLVIPNDVDHSILIDRFESTNPTVHMPALGTEMTDPTGDATLRAWITSLQ